MNLTPERLFHAIDATWPPAEILQMDPWTLRRGAGGGKRVSAATATGIISGADIDKAESAMCAIDQVPLFMIRGEDTLLDGALAQRGYQIVDPVRVLAAPIEKLTDVPIPMVTTFTVWEPLAIMREIWAQGGIGPARLNVMSRAGTKTAVFARASNRPAGVGFVAVDGDIAMVHAVEVLPQQRRQGVAQWIMRQAAFWAREQGAHAIAVLCTEANKPALSLYSALGFASVGKYHYRISLEHGET